MGNKPAFIKKIWQADNTHFKIEWNDGKEQNFQLAALQKDCPCAGCVDEETGQRRSKEMIIDENLRAVRIFNVGRYALRIQFEKGCSNGIYSFNHLRSYL